MRADNRGEGGIPALMSLTHASWRGRRRYLLLVGLAGAALLYGDGIITPAISVLSAVEGLNVASHAFAKYTVAITATILLLLFLVQRFGTAKVGNAFGPLMAIWFVTIAILGVGGIVEQPHVLAAVNPAYAVTFLAHQGVASLAILGAVFLSVTGAEAMYADMGHMGREAIRMAWFALVLPALLLNYAGQTAVLLGFLRRSKSILPACTALGALPSRRPRHSGNNHRQPSHHHRYVLANPTGHATGMVARRAYRTNLIERIRTDLRSRSELDDDVGNFGADYPFR